jgi:hypothetical protein
MSLPKMTVILAFALISCDGASGTSALCDTSVAVSVASGAAPQFSWTPACLVERLNVFENRAPSVGGPRLIWGIERAAGLAPPVRYGQTPGGAQVLLPPEPLASGGAQYLVEVSMSEPVGNSTIVGATTFVR